MISIIIPLFNSRKFILHTLRSILNQTSKNWECIIVNDGSTDGSKELVLNFVNQFNDFPFILLSQENKGPGIARNTGVQIAKFNYILFLDADDLISKRLIEESIKNIDLYGSDVIAFDMILFGCVDKIKIWKRRNYTIDDLKWNNWLPGGGVIIKKEIYKRAGGYSINQILTKGIEDFDFWIRVSVHLKTLIFVDNVYVFYRQLNSSRGKNICKERIRIYKFIFEKNKNIIGGAKNKFIFRAYNESSRHALIENEIFMFHKLCLEGFFKTLNLYFLKRLNLFYKIKI